MLGEDNALGENTRLEPSAKGFHRILFMIHRYFCKENNAAGDVGLAGVLISVVVVAFRGFLDKIDGADRASQKGVAAGVRRAACCLFLSKDWVSFVRGVYVLKMRSAIFVWLLAFACPAHYAHPPCFGTGPCWPFVRAWNRAVRRGVAM